MFSLKKSKGFTIVELLIVIVVIGILATLVIVTFSGIQQRGRDSQRKTDINALQSHVEAYYAQTGTYPTAAMINDDTWRGEHMKGLDPEAMRDPKAPDATVDLADGAATSTQYGYDTGVDGLATACTVEGTGAAMTSNCNTFTLAADLEGSTTNYEKKSN